MRAAGGAYHELRRDQRGFHGLAFDQPDEVLDQELAGVARVLADGRQRRVEVGCGEDVVEAHHGDVPRHGHAAVLHRVDHAHGDQVAGGEHAVERDAGIEQREPRAVALGFEALRVGVQPRRRREARRLEHFDEAPMAQLELRRSVGGRAHEGDAPPAQAQKVFRGETCAAGVVAADVMSGQVLDHRPPDDEMRLGFREVPAAAARI